VNPDPPSLAANLENQPADVDDIAVNPSSQPSVSDLIERRLSRRAALGTVAAAGASLASGAVIASPKLAAKSTAEESQSLGFANVPQVYDDKAHAPTGYSMQTLIAWGDPITADAPAFDPKNQSARRQARQFGYNNDFLAFMPLPFGSSSSDRGLLCVNHEYTDTELMFGGLPGYSGGGKLSRELTEIEAAAHGLAILEIRRRDKQWEVVRDSRYNRRLHTRSVFEISGPAAGDRRMKTTADPTGRQVFGTLNNCAGGVTPWGTVLSCEENFNKYFRGDASKTTEADALGRYGVAEGGDLAESWAEHDERFHVEREPHESNRFGWVVEYDPYNPLSRPVKRTALGRFKHEGAAVVLNPDGRVVVYSGDDQRFEYIYKFVSHGRYEENNRRANFGLLDSGTLFVAQLKEDGSLRWLPLVFGSGPLTPENGFQSQADVLIDCRKAGDLLGATPMDRPEDIEVSPTTGRVYVILTNNTKRTRVNAANPRPANKHGHVIELSPPSRGGKVDHGALDNAWEIFLLAGDPYKPQDGARYGAGMKGDSWLTCPDNAVFDNRGRLWLATDGAPKVIGKADGVYACPTNGPDRAKPRRFFAAPSGAEVCGPCFTPDGRTLLVAVQHPGEGSKYDKPSTRWPDFKNDWPPRPAVVAIIKDDGGEIGT